MAGGAALLTGGLLGFLFGVPHTRDDGTIQRRNDPERDGTRESSTSYRPNTSLEQIADWLTKILVGVGLVQIQVIPGKLVSLAKYVAQGLGSETETLALAILIYFSVCGFVFGFLWARLYLPRWFRDADDIQKLEQKVSQLEKRQAADAKALALTDQVLNRNADDPVSSDDVVAKAIKSASKSVRVQIFRQAEKASLNTKADDYETKIEGVISILKGLIDSDTKDYYHRNHSELAYALRRKKPEEWDAAEKEITRAIEIRDRLGIKGWKSYHLQRARCRIMQDKEFNRGRPSDAAARKSILDDLLAAYSDTEKWKRWTEPGSGDTARNIRKWCQLNNINEVAFA
jgi:flagellar biosynthesis regulator FlaF